VGLAFIFFSTREETSREMETMDRKTHEQRTGGAVRPEAVLSDRQLQLLAQAQSGELPCPWCQRPLSGDFVYVEVPDDDDYYAGVKLSCRCGFVEY
jgi:hypothetical protein